MRNLAIQFDELRVINIGAKGSLNRFQISPVPVAGHLNTIREPPRKITDKLNSRRATAIANAPRRNEFRVGADRNPSPHVARRLRRGLGEHDLALLGVDEAPNLVELDALARQIAEGLVLIGQTGFASIDQQLVDGVYRDIGKPTSRAKAVPLNKRVEDLGAFGDRQPVHASQYSDASKSGQASNHFGGRLFHRERAAARAISLRLVAVNRSARILPPRCPPSRPRATACGFFSRSIGCSSVSSPTERSTIRLASWFMSRGRSGRVFHACEYDARRRGLQIRSSMTAKLSHYRLARVRACGCGSAWNKDPVFGVIGIQSGPPGRRVHSGFRGGYGGQVGDAGSGDSREDPSGVFRP